MPKVSVILPCYNVEDSLPRSIESVLAQSLTDFELLVVIDGSPDNSKSIAESYAGNDSRIKIFEKQNGGLSDARNYGAERARGEWIYFMDSDDWIDPDLLTENVEFAEQRGLDFLVFGYAQEDVDRGGQIIDSVTFSASIDELLKGSGNLTIGTKEMNLLGYAWNKIYKRSFLELHDFRFQKGISLVEDILFNAPIYQVSEEIHFNPKIYYHYVNRTKETLTKQFHQDLFAKQKMRLIAVQHWLRAWKVPNEKEILAQVLMESIRYCIHNLYSYPNKLTAKEKENYVLDMYNDTLTRQWIDFYRADSLSSKFYYFLVKFKLQTLTCIGAQMMKR